VHNPYIYDPNNRPLISLFLSFRLSFLAYLPYFEKQKEAHEIILLSVCPSVCLCIPLLIFVRRLVRLPCYLCVRLNFFFYAVRVVPKESRRLVLPRTTYFFINSFILLFFTIFLLIISSFHCHSWSLSFLPSFFVSVLRFFLPVTPSSFFLS
jgi:hypothetical protein